MGMQKTGAWGGIGCKSERTAQRILEVCLRLFNEHGVAQTTTAAIAGAAGIREGNLWYHFRTKQDMLLRLYDGFEDALARLFSRDFEERFSPADYAAHQAASFRLVWEYRFLFRDIASVYRLCPSLKSRGEALAEKGLRHIESTLTRMRTEGLLRIDSKDIPSLAINVWIVSRYWLEFLYAHHGIEDLEQRHLEAGMQQLQALLVPYLTCSLPEVAMEPADARSDL